MKSKDLLVNISNVDNDLIAEAEASLTTEKKKISRYIGIAAAACLCLAVIGTIIGISAHDAVIYASAMDNSIFFAGTPNDKVSYMSDFSKFSNNAKVRVMAIVYDIEEGYPDIYGQLFDGKSYSELMDEYMEYVRNNMQNYDGISERWAVVADICQKLYTEMADEEIKWLKTIGAEDIERLQYDTYLFTISKADLQKFEGGKCKYRVAMAMKEFAHTNIKPEDLFGEYECVDMIFVSPLSSVAMMTDHMRGQTLSIDKNSVVFGDVYELQDVCFQVDTTKDCAEKFYGFEPIDYARMPDELVRLFSGEHIIFNVFGDHGKVRLFAGDGYVYLDRGLWGIFRFKAK